MIAKTDDPIRIILGDDLTKKDVEIFARSLMRGAYFVAGFLMGMATFYFWIK